MDNFMLFQELPYYSRFSTSVDFDGSFERIVLRRRTYILSIERLQPKSYLAALWWTPINRIRKPLLVLPSETIIALLSTCK